MASAVAVDASMAAGLRPFTGKINKLFIDPRLFKTGHT